MMKWLQDLFKGNQETVYFNPLSLYSLEDLVKGKDIIEYHPESKRLIFRSKENKLGYFSFIQGYTDSERSLNES